MRHSPKRLEKVRWEGEATYRVLSYYLSLRWNSRSLGDYARHVLEPFEVAPDPQEERNPPTPGLPPLYSLLSLSRSAKRPHRLLLGLDLLLASDDPELVLQHLFWHINSESVRATGSFLLIHAGAAVSPVGDGILLPADSGAGKSTLVTGLVRAGFAYLSDEAGAIDPVSRRLYPYQKAISLKTDGEGGFVPFPDLRPSGNGWSSRQWHLRAEDIRPDSLGRPCEVRFIIAPRYRKGASTELSPMTRAESVVELARNTANLSLYGGRALPLLVDVVRRAEGYRLISGNLEEAVRAIAELTGRGTRGGAPRRRPKRAR